MSEEIKNEIDDVVELEAEAEEVVNNDELKDTIEQRFKALQMQSMLLGAQAITQTVANKIYAFETQPGKKTLNDFRRLTKDIKAFCETALDKVVNPDGTTSDADSTKLMEDEGAENDEN